MENKLFGIVFFVVFIIFIFQEPPQVDSVPCLSAACKVTEVVREFNCKLRKGNPGWDYPCYATRSQRHFEKDLDEFFNVQRKPAN